VREHPGFRQVRRQIRPVVIFDDVFVPHDRASAQPLLSSSDGSSAGLI
jgi:hypothetical protein